MLPTKNLKKNWQFTMQKRTSNVMWLVSLYPDEVGSLHSEHFFFYPVVNQQQRKVFTARQ